MVHLSFSRVSLSRGSRPLQASFGNFLFLPETEIDDVIACPALTGDFDEFLTLLGDCGVLLPCASSFRFLG